MTPTVITPQKFGRAISNDDSKIVATGTLGSASVTIEATGPVAWAIAIGVIGVAAAGVVAAFESGGVATQTGATMEGNTFPTSLPYLDI